MCNHQIERNDRKKKQIETTTSRQKEYEMTNQVIGEKWKKEQQEQQRIAHDQV